MARFTYYNTGSIQLPDFVLTSQSLHVYGTSGTITNVVIALDTLTHGYPDDLDMLLVAPNGKRNILFMSDAGGTWDLNSVDLVFSDAGTSNLPDTTQIVSGTFRPTDYEIDETDADFGTSTGGILSGSTTTFAAAFNSYAANGDWTLYIHDDSFMDSGSLAGWHLDITTNSDQARITGTAGSDLLKIWSVDGTSGNFVLNSNNGVFYSGVTSWDISGGGGTDTIQFAAYYPNFFTYDLTGSNLTSIEVLQYTDPGTNGSATVRIGASEIGAGFASNGSILGVFDTGVHDTFDIVMGTDTNVDLSAIAFNYFDGPYDQVTITGDGSAETIVGSSVHDVIAGNGGNDQISGGGGDDLIEGGTGADTINGGANGPSGDTASYVHSSAGVIVELQYGVFQGGDAQGDTLTGIENLTGSGHADTLYGNPGANIIHGGNGGDHIKGLKGADYLFGDDGDDWVYMDAADLAATGDAGFDRLFVTDLTGVAIAVDTAGFEVATGNVGNDTFNGALATADLGEQRDGGLMAVTGRVGDALVEELPTGTYHLRYEGQRALVTVGPGLAYRLEASGSNVVLDDNVFTRGYGPHRTDGRPADADLRVSSERDSVTEPGEELVAEQLVDPHDPDAGVIRVFRS